MYTYL